MNDEVLVKVEHVSKKFCRDLKRSLLYGVSDIAAELIGNRKSDQLREKEFWAVNDVSFELKRGQCLGLIGHNGAGKSTLLKMLNGLIKPDKGKITMRGRIGALIELGAGFNPILTGRENVYNNGAVLGFSKREINKKFDAIVDFAEIGAFIDTPVVNYSSGMKVRLGFAVAAQMEPDVLLVDEVLAVGDLGFRIKCYNEIYKIIERAAVIFVSHSMPEVSRICNTGLMLKNGSSHLFSQDVSQVVLAYYSQFGGEKVSVEGSNKASIRQFSFGNLSAMTTVQVADGKFQQPNIEVSNEAKVKFEALVEVDPGIRQFSVIISVIDVDQKLVAQITPKADMYDNTGSLIKVCVELDTLMLNTGKYTLSIHLFRNSEVVDRGEIITGIRSAIKFSVKNNKFTGAAPILYRGNWS